MMNNHQAPHQFPQPTKPVHAQDTLPFQSFQTTAEEETSNFVVDDNFNHQPQNYYYYYNYSDEDDEKNHDHKFLKKIYAKVEEEIGSLKTSIEDGDVESNQILGLFTKFGAKLNKKIMKHSSDQNYDVIIQERGVVDIEVDQKLERFRVRTVNLGSGGGGGQGEDDADEVPKN